MSQILLIGLLLLGGGIAAAQEDVPDEPPEEKPSWTARTGARAAFVADAGLAALRITPSATGDLKQRLRVGRRVYVLGQRRIVDGRTYVFVAVTRRTRGWLDQRAVVRANARGDDTRLLALARVETAGYERLRLCRLFETLFRSSPQLPTALLLLGETADAEAEAMQRRAVRRVQQRVVAGNADEASYFDNDPGLDRYNRLGVKFRYDSAKKRYRYDGAAYRRLARQYPQTPEADKARQWLSNQ
ncbi:MAG: hypothetical protein SNJ67_11865 [Chloracidobacterium sp.]|uniref:SH3b domain-containing protein n=1 Tax=Chloracidobacterium validum TaxID=2821543 RepID=A0ABX8B6L2_9BACT|nr:hypothetical protein [Chloracidobacterium validum]QUW02607.1 hypothetical protein J8C06_09690 [Chloracidobacterium validum]